MKFLAFDESYYYYYLLLNLRGEFDDFVGEILGYS